MLIETGNNALILLTPSALLTFQMRSGYGRIHHSSRLTSVLKSEILQPKVPQCEMGRN